MKHSMGKRLIAVLLCLAVFAGSELTGLTHIVGALSATELSAGDETAPAQDVDTVSVEAPSDDASIDTVNTAESIDEDSADTEAPDGGSAQPGAENGEAADNSGKDTVAADGDSTQSEAGNEPGATGGDEEETDDGGQSAPSGTENPPAADDQENSGEPSNTEEEEKPSSNTEDQTAPAEDDKEGPSVSGDEDFRPGGDQEILTGPETTDPAADAEQEPENDEENAGIYDKFQDGSLEDLMNVDKETVTAAMTLTEPAPAGGRRMMRARAATSWNAAAYYVDEDDSCDVLKTDDFSLKYQIEFHTDTEIPARGVTFRVPSLLLSERDGTEHYADDIAVPRAEDYTDSDGKTQHKDVPAKTISFNYYEETVDGVEYYVFYNYETLPRGTNAAFQVLYKKMEAMDLVDDSSWTLPVTAEVKPSKDAEETEEKLLATLTGRVDTEAKVTSLTKAPYYSPATSNYTPGLYTKRQVDQYATQKTENYKGIVEENFDKYFYAVWSVRLSVEATQAFYVDLKENIPEDGGGRVVGVSYESPYMRLVMQDSPSEDPNQFRIYAIAEGYEWEQDEDGSYYQKVRKADYGTLRIVMAYPREDLENGVYNKVEEQSDLTGWTLTNSITAIATGVDGVDTPSELLSEDSSFTYREYKWTYGQPSLSASKSNAEGGVYSVFNGWNNIYLQSKAAGADRGDFVFNTSALMQDYGHTHDVKAIGAPVIEGKYSRLTVADDLLYLSESEGGMDYKNPDRNHLLTEQDYYFSSVRVNLKDYDYDIWEDTTIPTDEANGYECRSTKIYAMYAKPGEGDRADGHGWYLVEEKDGFLAGYEFTTGDLAKEPYRVKVEHESNAHTLSASIQVAVRFRKESQLLEQDFFASLENGVTLENNVGIVRERVEVDDDGATYEQQFQGAGDIDDLETVRADERTLYPDGQVPERYRNYDPDRDQRPWKNNTQGFAYLNPSKPRSRTFKCGTITNDPVNERVNQRYNLVVYNGYDIYDETVVNYMKSAESSTPNAVSGSPGHSEVVFYDLLPLGVKYDPSVKIIAGRITSLDEETIRKYPDAWEQDDVTVTVDEEDDVFDNYGGTGRTLVRFHLKYQKGDPSVFATYKDRRMWMEGWGVSFGSYYSWKDEDIAKDAENIFAFSTAEGDERPLVGSASGPCKVCADDGELPWIDHNNEAEDTAYRPLVGDGGLRGGDPTLKSVIFGKGGIEDDFAKSSQAEVIKRVRADDDPYGAFEKEAEVSLGGDYTYELTVRVTQGEVKGLVVYDCLGKAVSNLSQTDQDKIKDGSLSFDDNWWYGTFNGVVTNELTQKGIAPKIYYSAGRDAVRPGQEIQIEKSDGTTESKTFKSFQEILGDPTYKDVWVEASAWEESGKSLADVKSIAMDLSKKASGEDFVLENMDAVSFQIKMTAPNAFQESTSLEDDQISRENKEKPATWAYNNSSYTSQSEAVQLNTSDAVRVRLRDSKKMTVEKQVDGEIPDAYKDASFTMKIGQRLDEKSSYTPYANKSYILYEKDAQEGWVKVDSVVRATDANGCLPLKAGQKAELNISDKALYQVTEVESPFWKQTIDVEPGEEITNSDGSISLGTDEYTIINEYRPVLYVQKSVIGCPPTVDKKSQMFRFQLVTVDENGAETPVKDQEYWYVDSAYGDMPKKLGTGRTNEKDGSFIVRPGEILAMFPGEPGTKYIVRELSTPNDAWVVYEGKAEVSGTLGLSANRATITNLYRWRELAVTKELTHQDSAECTQSFTFRVEKVTENADGTTTNVPVTGNAWTLYNADGTEYKNAEGDPVTGTLDEGGRFTAACAGKTVRVQELEAGATYLVKEEVYEDGTSASEMGNDGQATEGSDYRPLTSTLIAEMPVYSQKRELTFTNDYLLRPITVSKTVAYDAAKMKPEDLSELKNKTFTMTIYTRNSSEETWQPYGNQVFARSGAAANASLANVTDAGGQFEIRDGETITFKDAGRSGLQYKVEEVPDETYGQIYPAPDAENNPTPVEDVIGSEGGKAVFINGTAGLLMLGKEYTADTEDNGTAAAYLAKIKTDAELREKEAVTVTLEIKGSDDEWTAYKPETEDTEMTVIDTLATKNAAETVAWSSLVDETGALKLEPWKRVVVPMDGETEYRIRESEADRGKLYRTKDCGLEGYESGYLAVEAQTAEAGGTVERQPVATLVNRISSIDPVSSVAKAMRGGSTPVPAGERLVLQVQRYTGAEWKPAGGIRYIVTDFDPTVAADRQQERPVSAGVLETDADGRIVVTKSDDSEYTASERGTQLYPRIGFVSEVVRPEASVTDWKAGDYRLVELLTESGSRWGGWYQSAWDPDKSAGTIWNSNRPLKVRIGKELEEDVIDDGSTFTFHLKQVTKLKEDTGPNLKADDILASKDAGGIRYEIYDADDQYVGPGQTNAAGEIRLKAGQYAILEVTDATRWTVSEKQSGEMKLTNLTAVDNAGKLAPNLAVINAQAAKVPAYIRAESDSGILFGTPQNIRNTFTVTLVWSDGTEETLNPLAEDGSKVDGKYRMEATTNEDGSVKCRFTSAEYPNLFDTLTLEIPASGECVDFTYIDEKTAQTYKVPETGIYQIELWGASGGGNMSPKIGSHGGRGGYVKGWIELKKGTVLYIYVGQQGGLRDQGGWNGGGKAWPIQPTWVGSSGGGATDVRIEECDINTLTGDPLTDPRIIVAGGGGGADNTDTGLTNDNGSGGHAGGWEGEAGYCNGKKMDSVILPGTQLSGYKAGQGESVGKSTDAGAGGGGWYGGRSGWNMETGGGNSGGAGGSSYISGVSIPDQYKAGYKFSYGETISGKESMVGPDGKTDTGRWGDGYARIRLVSKQQ